MAKPAPIYRQVYSGGETAFMGELDPSKPNTLFTASGFEWGDGGAVLNIFPVGATEPQAVTFDAAIASFRLLDTPIASFTVSGLAEDEDAYEITAYQWI
jgi:hypothetical protein